MSASLASFVALVWAPFGLHISPTNDHWIVRAWIQDSGGFLWHGDPSRMIGLWPYSLGLWITPNSFVGDQLVLAGLTLGRGIALFGILKAVTRDLVFSWLAAVLVLFYPADTGHFWLGALSVHGASTVLLCAFWLLVTSARELVISRLVLLFTCLAAALWTHDAVLPMALVGPFLLFAAEREKKTARIAVAGWYSICSFWSAAKILYWGRGGGGRAAAVVDLDPQAMWQGLLKAFSRCLASGWSEAIRSLSSANLWMVVGVGLVCGITTSLLLRLQRRSNLESSLETLGSRIRAVLIGSVVLGIGFLPFVPSVIRLDTRRTLILASIGAAIVTAGAVLSLARIRRIEQLAVIVGTALATALSASYGLYEHGQEVAVSRRQVEFLAEILEEVPSLPPEVSVVVVFEDKRLRRSLRGFGLREGLFSSALQFLYGSSRISGYFEPPIRSDGEPVVEGSMLHRRNRLGERQSLPISLLVVLSFSRKSGAKLVTDLSNLSGISENSSIYQPQQLIEAGAPAARACTLLPKDLRPSHCDSGE